MRLPWASPFGNESIQSRRFLEWAGDAWDRRDIWICGRARVDEFMALAEVALPERLANR
jgi:hypothetical protein